MFSARFVVVTLATRDSIERNVVLRGMYSVIRTHVKTTIYLFGIIRGVVRSLLSRNEAIDSSPAHPQSA
jgi:hypothetical protein